MVWEPQAGRRRVFVRKRRTRLDFAAVVKTLCDELYPQAEKIVLVMDQLNTRGVASLYEALGHVALEHRQAVLGHPDHMALQVRDAVYAVVVRGHPRTITPPPNALKANRLKTVGFNRVAGN